MRPQADDSNRRGPNYTLIHGGCKFSLCPRNLTRQHACIGYITGIADVLAEGDTVDGWRACISLGVTNSRLTNVVKSWLEQHVENRHRSAPRLVAEALAEAYPCE